MLRFAATGISHVGLVRANNQDSAVVSGQLLLVADGVGGGAAGEVASATAAAAVLAVVRRSADEAPVLVLPRAVRRAQEQLARGVELQPDRAGMAATLTAVLTDGTATGLVHLGDSRAFVLRAGELVQITRDHTWTAKAVRRGEISEAAAENHPWRHVIVRSLNGVPAQSADVLSIALRVGDRLLVASDGLTDLVAVDRIQELLEGHDDRRACEALVSAALAQGGRDNITVVVASVIDPDVSDIGSQPERLLGAIAEGHHTEVSDRARSAG